jgi:hypothetical protein
MKLCGHVFSEQSYGESEATQLLGEAALTGTWTVLHFADTAPSTGTS